METRNNLATGHARTAFARTRLRNGWSEIATVLNNVGNGCIKDWKQWSKYWKDKKAAVKRKMEIAKQRKVGEVDDEEVLELTALDQRILTISGVKISLSDEKPTDSKTALRSQVREAHRRLLQQCPAPQRSPDLTSLTESFIAIEERRVEAELASARAREASAQGHIVMAAAIDRLTDTIRDVAQQTIEALLHSRAENS